MRLCHVRVEGRVREMLEARAVVCAGVEGSGNVGGQVAVAVFSLVVARELAQQRGRAEFGDGSFAIAGDGGSVVAKVFERGVADVEQVCHHVQLGEHGRLLEVAVGDGARGIVGGHDGGLDVDREGVAPVVGLSVGTVEDTSHTGLGGVGGAQSKRTLSNYFCQVRGSLAKVGGESSKAGEAALDQAVDAYPVAVGLVLGPL
jgi:hypothetical protein